VVFWTYNQGSGWFRIVSDYDAKVVDVSGVSTADGARAVQWDYVGGANQQWRLAWSAAGVFAVVAQHSGKVLEVGGQSTTDGVPVGQWADLGLANQRWRIIPG
jgi:Ricin-type beta-trefoil lectin domain-like